MSMATNKPSNLQLYALAGSSFVYVIIISTKNTLAVKKLRPRTKKMAMLKKI